MHLLQTLNTGESRPWSSLDSPRIVLGITHACTCLTLTGRIRAFREAGFQVALVCSAGELLNRIALKEGAAVFEIPMQRRIAPISDLVSFVRIFRLLRRLSPHVVEFSTPKAGLLGCMAAWCCRVPVRIYMLRGLKLETSTGFKRWILQISERLAAGCAHVVLCNSPSLRQAAAELRIAPRSKLKLLGLGSSNGVDIQRFSPRLRLMRNACGLRGSPVLGFVGRLTRDKGLPELLEAFDRILAVAPEARLLLVGFFDAAEDALDSACRERIQHHPRIYITGYVRDTSPYYGLMDLLVFPSLREGFPNAVLEAAASGVAVVAADATGTRDAVLPGRTGLLVPPCDAGALTSAILSLMRNGQMRASMGKAARAWVEEHFVDKQVLGMAVRYYSFLLENRMEKPIRQSGASRPMLAATPFWREMRDYHQL